MMTDASPDAAPRAESDVVTFRLKRSVLFTGAGLVLGFGLGLASARFLLSGAASATVPIVASALAAAPVVDTTPKVIETTGRPSRGPTDAKVTIVEFTDYQCPYCRQHFAQTLPSLFKKYGDRVRYVVMNYPLSSIHEFANGAAEGAECAADQGKFWEYHDKLFRATRLDAPQLKRFAAQLKLDAGAFASCLSSGAKSGLVQQQVVLGSSLGVSGTPTIFINGRALEGAQPLPVMELAIERALAAASR